MDFLPQQNRRVSSEPLGDAAEILAGGKHVVVIGGGDTGSDCIGTSGRQGAASITQLEIMPMPPEREDKGLVWPDWPLKLRTSSSQEEGCERDFAVTTVRAVGEGKVEAIECARVDWGPGEDGRMQMNLVPGSEFVIPADLVLLAMGFVGPQRAGLVEQSGVELDLRGNVRASTDDYRSTAPKVFACGDMRRGQSLVVWAIREGRQCARAVDEFLTGESLLPR
jgi:glutamate synthase (NADPH/NADH) small chain